MSEQHIVIVGGGMVGVSLALLLNHSALAVKVTLVEEAPLPEADPNPRPSSFDERTTVLSAGSADILKTMQCWPALSPLCEPITQVHVSDRGHFGGSVLNAKDHQREALGYVVANRLLGQVLLQALHAAPIEIVAPAKVTGLKPKQKGYQVSLEYGAGAVELTPDLLLIADGADSGLAQSIGIGIASKDYHQQAMIANIGLKSPHNGVAYERFTDTGPMALLPLPSVDGQHRAALVWTLPDEMQSQIAQMDDEALLNLLQQRFGYRAGELVHIGERHFYPLRLVQAEEQVRSHLALVGNAAHLLHPAAGQGFNLSLRDCEVLVSSLEKAAVTEQPLGDLSVLNRYVAARNKDQFLTIELTDQMVNRFSSQRFSNVLGRQLGLLGLNVSPVIKNSFARQMMGVSV